MTRPRESAEKVTALTVAAGRVLRPHLGWICCTAGALLCALGWYGVSGERYAARQIPYLASATAPGVALIVGGLVLLAARSRSAAGGAAEERMRLQVALLYRLLTEAEEPPAEAPGVAGAPGTSATRAATAPAATRRETAEQETAGREAAGRESGADGGLLTVPGGRTYHRPECPLIEGRLDPEPVTRSGIAERGLRPCPLCDPPER
ncbi:hypothetical protein [Streptacidiphilus sp. EB129]|uniref:hypothetical protein n=1 Tax=Streptacidiphilus sp. EB129 TaxID=3156262 RepID=UPI0035127268